MPDDVFTLCLSPEALEIFITILSQAAEIVIGENSIGALVIWEWVPELGKFCPAEWS